MGIARAGDEPFVPAGVDWTAVSPRLRSVRQLLSGLVCLVVAAIVAVVALASGQGELWWLMLVPAAAALWLLWLIPRQVRAWGYAEREDDLLVRHGVMRRVLVVVPYGRMQYVDVQAGLIDRMFGIARVQLHTASAHTDATIPGLLPPEASRLRDRLTSRGEARLAGL